MLKPIDKTLPALRHEQVYDSLRDLIRSGALAEGDKLLADTELAERFGVSKMTAHRALQSLAADGWLTRTVGKGTFVAPRRTPGAIRRVVLAFGAATSNILGSDYYGSLYQGIADALGERVELTLLPEAFSASHLPEADGVLVLAPREASLESVRALLRVNRPVVLVGGHWEGLNLPSVDSDNSASSSHVVEHLAAQGHQTVVLLYAEPETANTRDRIAGFRAAVSALGLTGIEREAAEFYRLSEGEKRTLAKLVTGDDRATAVFAAGYFLALDALNALREAGRVVPDDVSVVGFDDPRSARLVFPALTTVRQPLYEMGRRAAQRLRALVESHSAEAGVELLPAQLIVRSSTSLKKGFRQ